MDGIIDGAISEPEWLEIHTSYWNLRVWHIIFFCFSGVLSIAIMLCCCFRFRIPRTKQDIEADYQRRIITKKFRERLARIKNSEMDDMNLQKALDRVRQDYLVETQRTMNLPLTKNAIQTITAKNNDNPNRDKIGFCV